MSTHLKSPGSVQLSPACPLRAQLGVRCRSPNHPHHSAREHTVLQGNQPRAREKPQSLCGHQPCAPRVPCWGRGAGGGEGPPHTPPRKHQYFMGSSLLTSNFVLNCHETIQNFQLRANRLLSASQPEQAGVIILKASDGAVHCTGSPNCLSAGAAVLLQAPSTLSLHAASRPPERMGETH